MKKLSSLILILIIAFTLSTSVIARYSYTNQAYSRISISGSTATVTGYVSMTSEAEDIDITTRLFLNGSEIKSWSTPTSTTSRSRTIRKTVQLNQRGTYHVETEYTVYGPNGSDHDTVSSDEAIY